MHTCYFYLVNHYFDPAVLFTRVWSIDNLGLVAAVLIISCQCFYARRVWLIGPQYRLLVVITVFLFLGELACATYATAKAGLLPSYSEFRELTWLFSVAFALVVVSDIILTAVLIFVLHRSRSGISRTDSMLDVLIAYTISTGLLTEYITSRPKPLASTHTIPNSIFSGLSFIFPLVYLNTNSMVYIALDIVTTKLYVNSVIGTLNFRRTLATHKSGTAGLEIGLSNLARSRPAGPPSGPLGFAAATSSTSAGSMQSVVEIKVAQDLDQFPSTATVDVPARRPYGSEVNV